MPSYDRDYARGNGGAFGAGGLPPVVKWILILNIGIFLLDILIFGNQLSAWGQFAVASGFGEFRIYELVTFQFLHGSVLHLVFNSIGIYFIGPLVERWWGSRRFLRYYLLCGVGGALLFTVLALIGLMPGAFPLYHSLVGASAGLFGLLIAAYFIAPEVRVRLLIPPIELSIRQLVKFLMIFAVVVILGAMVFPDFLLFGNSGGEAGHLGGAITGFFLMKYPWLLNWRRPTSKLIRPKEFRGGGRPKLRPRTEVNLDSETEVDRILDKINAEGLGSLTDDERKLLERKGEKRS